MSRSKELWQAECDAICEQYMNGIIPRKVAIDELWLLGWWPDDAERELDAWKEGE